MEVNQTHYIDSFIPPLTYQQGLECVLPVIEFFKKWTNKHILFVFDPFLKTNLRDLSYTFKQEFPDGRILSYYFDTFSLDYPGKNILKRQCIRLAQMKSQNKSKVSDHVMLPCHIFDYIMIESAFKDIPNFEIFTAKFEADLLIKKIAEDLTGKVCILSNDFDIIMQNPQCDCIQIKQQYYFKYEGRLDMEYCQVFKTYVLKKEAETIYQELQNYYLKNNKLAELAYNYFDLRYRELEEKVYFDFKLTYQEAMILCECLEQLQQRTYLFKLKDFGQEIDLKKILTGPISEYYEFGERMLCDYYLNGKDISKELELFRLYWQIN